MKPINNDYDQADDNLSTFNYAFILITIGILEYYVFSNIVGAKLFILLFTINFFQIFIWAACLENQFNSFLRDIEKNINLWQPQTSLSMITFFFCIFLHKIFIYSNFPLLICVFLPLGITQNLWLVLIKQLLFKTHLKLKVHTQFDQRLQSQILSQEGWLQFIVQNIILVAVNYQYNYFGYLTFNINNFFLTNVEKQQKKVILLFYSVIVAVNFIFSENYFVFVLTQILAPLMLNKYKYFSERIWIFNLTLLSILFTKLLMQYGFKIEFPQVNLFLVYIIFMIIVINFNVILIPNEVKLYIPIINSLLRLPVMHILALFLFVYTFENEQIEGYESLIVYFFLTLILYNLMRFICYTGRKAQEKTTVKQKKKREENYQNQSDFMGEDKFLLHSFEKQTKILQKIILITYFCMTNRGYAIYLIFLLAFQFDREFLPYNTLIALFSSKQLLLYFVKFFHYQLINKNKLLNILIFNLAKEKLCDELLLEIVEILLAIVLAYKHQSAEKILIISLPLWVYIVLYSNISPLISVLMIILCVNKLIYI